MRDQKLQTFNKARAIIIRNLIFTGLICALFWLLLYSVLPPVPDMAEPLARLIFALKCWGMASLFCIVLGIEAVTYEKLGTSVITSLGDGESLRLRINRNYLQQTAEQMLVFVPGLLLLAIYCDNSESMRLVEVATLSWIAARFLFWFSYHKDIQSRTPGMIGMLQNTLILLYGCTRFSYDLWGIFGAIFVVSVFVTLEIYLLAINKL